MQLSHTGSEEMLGKLRKVKENQEKLWNNSYILYKKMQ